MTGTFGGALEARGIPAGEGRLVSECVGEIEKDGNVLVVRRIHVRYTLKAAPEHHATAERVHGFHADYCPVARTIRNCVQITTELHIEPLEA
ncbi:OsmC family protein [Ardenticatena maritima]|uniref:OsmC family protein n=1 Tax=Ardenticatena maritima TaxID=872965 RepID=UPI0009E8B0F0|nr:OsmC family protein [Ardenticatena maritima]